MRGKDMIDGKEWVFWDHEIINDDLYFIAKGYLLKCNINAWTVQYVLGIRNLNWVLKYGISYVESIDDTLFFVGGNPFVIAKLDRTNNTIVPIYSGVEEIKIFNIERWNDKILIFPKLENEVIEINKNGEIKKYPFVMSEDKTKMLSCRVENEVWFVSKNRGKNYKYDFVNQQLSELTLPFQLNNCIDIKYIDRNLFILEGKSIIKWDLKSDFLKFQVKSENIDEDLYGMLIPLNNIIFLLPKKGDDILMISYDGEVSKYTNYPKDFAYTASEDWLKIGTKFLTYVIKNGIYYFPRRYTNYMMTIDSVSEEIKWIEMKEPSIVEEIGVEEFYNQGIVKEKKGFLSSLLRDKLDFD